MLVSSSKVKRTHPLASKRFYLLFTYVFLASIAVFGLPNQTSTRTIRCSNSDQLKLALSTAQPGDLILLDSSRTFIGNFEISKSGTSSAPIVIRTSTSTKAALVATTRFTGNTLHITGDYIRVRNLIITGGKKGIMLDNANYNRIEDVEVHNTGEEGVHFRDGSSYNVIKNSHIHDTGKLPATRDVCGAGCGEGVYVGSDLCKWNDWTNFTKPAGCKDEPNRFNKAADRNIISGLTIGPNVTAESIDIKEGTKGTVVELCTFLGIGISGLNHADSFIDAKGNDAVIRHNLATRAGNIHIVDAFQVHERFAGWGINNDFNNNTVNLDFSQGYVVNVESGSARVHNNRRTPAALSTWGFLLHITHLYRGNYTPY